MGLTREKDEGIGNWSEGSEGTKERERSDEDWRNRATDGKG